MSYFFLIIRHQEDIVNTQLYINFIFYSLILHRNEKHITTRSREGRERMVMSRGINALYEGIESNLPIPHLLSEDFER